MYTVAKDYERAVREMASREMARGRSPYEDHIRYVLARLSVSRLTKDDARELLSKAFLWNLGPLGRNYYAALYSVGGPDEIQKFLNTVFIPLPEVEWE